MKTYKIKHKKGIVRFLVLLMACSLLSCAKSPDSEAAQLVEEAEEAVPTEVAAPAPGNQDAFVGFIVPDAKDIALTTMKHGFLRTAETLGYPSKLYYAKEGAASVSAVEQAVIEGCTGLLIWNPNNVNAAAISKAAELAVPVVVPYHRSDNEDMSANVVADLNGYMEEVALGVAQRMVERSCKSGRILVYGSDAASAYKGFVTAIAEYYPQYIVASFSRKAMSREADIEELATFILWNRDVKGMFCTDADGAYIAVKAREQADKWFKANGAPEKKPDAEPPLGVITPGATPAPEGLTTQIMISVAGYGYSQENISLLRTNDIYAFVLEPYYEASAQSLMLLDRVLSGESVPKSYRLNMPIVRISSLEKYVQIDEQAREWFGLQID